MRHTARSNQETTRRLPSYKQAGEFYLVLCTRSSYQCCCWTAALV